MLSARQTTILRLVTEGYIASAHPVPSATIADRLGLSSATVRSEFGALEDAGYVQQPHPSAGRMPTAHGYRWFAESCMPPRDLPERLRRTLREQLSGVHGLALVEAIARTSADLSGYAVVLSLPTGIGLKIHEIHLSLLSSRRLLAVVVLENGLVRQLAIELEPAPDPDVLDEAERSLRRIARSLGELAGELRTMAGRTVDPELARTLRALAEAWPAIHPPVVVSDGLRHLLGEPEAHDPAFVRRAVARVEGEAAPIDAETAPKQAPAPLRLRLDDTMAQVVARVPLAPAPGPHLAGTLTLIGPARMRYPAALMVARGVAELASAHVAGGEAA